MCWRCERYYRSEGSRLCSECLGRDRMSRERELRQKRLNWRGSCVECSGILLPRTWFWEVTGEEQISIRHRRCEACAERFLAEGRIAFSCRIRRSQVPKELTEMAVASVLLKREINKSKNTNANQNS